MKFVFWQNIISIHQSAFLNALTAHHELTLVVEKDIEEERKGQGWNIPGLERINVVVAPTDAVIEILGNGAAAAADAGLFPVAHNLLSLRLRYRPDDALASVLRSLEDS